MKYSLSSKVIFPWGAAGGELGDSARNTLPRIDLGAGGELGVATDNTPPGPGLGAAGAFGVSARNTLPRIDLGAEGYQLLPLKRNRKMCDSILYAPMDELEFERLLGLATLFNDNDEWPIDFTELQELSELLGKLKSCVDVAIDNAPEAAKS
ncbi:hypothetical protein OD762_09890 [Pseudomonas aeruginosa]|uniref:hypothetical protein n=2 Tax=Pseudomonas aeruginosa TaxID=287 RepID=UPI001CF69D33|nr:hypothetical protein [Pseudomonas aeruginosa]MCS8258368.1 hypothetical protein [Pseudomonas aeruginosa]MCS9626151.1 hypothetical protein [Pseudomonas aeruginosa]MCV4359037.1 hypothetical protein [Pseudomonas aeruginosa]